MIVIKEDLVSGMAGEYGPDGDTESRLFKVKGLTRLPASSFAYRASTASALNGISIPEMFSAHPTRPNYLLERKSVRNVLNAREQARVLCQYRNYGYLIIRINGNVLRTETRF